MLYLIGLGLNDEKDLTLKSLEIAKKCECFCELYTSGWKGSIKNLEELIEKKIKILKRKDLEENLEIILEKARKSDIAIFVPGDPLVATTHIDIVLEAKKKKIKTEIIHNASIYSAIGETGLQIYKFGKTATIPLSGKMANVKKTVKTNKKHGFHTLLLLDLDKEVNIFLHVNDALKLLLKNKIVSETDMLLVFSNAGRDSKLYYDTVKSLIWKNIETPAVIIIPGRLHFREKEFLDMIS